MWFNRDMTIRLDTRYLPAEAPLVAGVSGGPDSLCLLDLLHAAGYRVIVAHFNHQLRPGSDREAASVAERARQLGLPYLGGSGDVRRHADEQRLSLEEAARLLRYRFLFAVAREQGAAAVAVGHTADDQVETVLMHFLRGAGLAGLKGMERRLILPTFDAVIPLVRPILHLRRAETEAYCRAHNLQPACDPSNADTAYFRNRLRHELIPQLEQYNPRFKETLLRSARSLQDDFDLLQGLVDSAWDESLLESGAGWVAFRRQALAGLPPGLRRNLLRRAVRALRPESRDFGFDPLERAAEFAASPAAGRLDLVEGLYLYGEGEKLYLAAGEADLPAGSWPQVQAPLDIQAGLVELGNGWSLSVEEMDGEAARRQAQGNRDPYRAWADAALTGDRLRVRGRGAGDRFAPLGMGGQTVRLQDFFINLKIPRRVRPKWPLVCADDRIVWVAGLRLAHPFRVTEKTERALKLILKKK